MKRLFPWMVEGKTKMGAWQDEDQWRCEEREKERERDIHIQYTSIFKEMHTSK